VNFLGSTFFLKNPKPKELRQLWFARTFGFNESLPLSQPSTGVDGQSEIASGYPNHVSSQQYATPPGSFGGDLSQGGIVPLNSSLTNTSIGLEKDNINNPALSTQSPGQESQSAAYEEALTLYEQGRYKEVTEKLLVLATLSTNAQATELLTRAYANQGNLDKALEWCEKAIAIDKLNPGFHYLRATILQEQGRFDEAIGSFRRTLYLDPNFVLAYFALGSIAAQQGKIKESKKHLNNAQRLLQSYNSEDVLPESDGMTTGRLREIVNTMLLATV
jgi:tetratricopeptide (TPR) repeat protein